MPLPNTAPALTLPVAARNAVEGEAFDALAVEASTTFLLTVLRRLPRAGSSADMIGDPP